jgi:hypothetical protein
MALKSGALTRVKFAPRRKRLNDGRLWYVIEYVDLSMAFLYFGVHGSSPEDLYVELMNVISGDVMSEPIRLSKATACQIGWRIFVHDDKDAVYLKLLGESVFR